jgi:hypothetical protein
MLNDKILQGFGFKILSVQIESTSFVCAVKSLQPGRNAPSIRDRRNVELCNSIWVQLHNSKWIYFIPTTDNLTVICRNKEPIDVPMRGVGKLSLISGCKADSTSALLLDQG